MRLDLLELTELLGLQDPQAALLGQLVRQAQTGPMVRMELTVVTGRLGLREQRGLLVLMVSKVIQVQPALTALTVRMEPQGRWEPQGLPDQRVWMVRMEPMAQVAQELRRYS